MGTAARKGSTRRRVLASVAVLVLAGGAAGPALAVDGISDDARTMGRPGWAGELLRAEPVDAGGSYPAGTSVHRIRYLSSTPAGEPTVVSGLTLVPAGPAPDGGWPIIAWAHGTTGIGDDCAPSAVEGSGVYYPELARFLADGYAIAATDYPGLGTPGVHPYLIPDSEARAMIDSVPAARTLTPSLSTRWVAAGHSQGGQGAIATAEIAEDYDSGLRFGGAVAYAPAPNTTDSVDSEVELGPLEQAFYSMLLVGLRTQYRDLSYGDYLGPRARALLPAVHSQCLEALAVRFFEAGLPNSEFAFRDDPARERLRRWFAAQEIGQRRTDAPILIVQGTEDPLVPARLTEELVTESRGKGSQVDYHLIAGADHESVVEAGAPAAHSWLAEHTRE